MQMYYGVVRNNRIELDKGAQLANGLRVEIRPQAQTTIASDDAEHMLLQHLYAAGLLEDDADGRGREEPFEPVIVQGEPLSEQIIRERR